MKKKVLLNVVLCLLFFLIHTGTALAQNNTSAAMNGRILDETGVGMSGASLLAIHTPTGTQYNTITLPDGKYNLPNIKTGGPYEITVSFVGYDSQTQKNIFLSLGQNLTQNFAMSLGSVILENVTVLESKDDIINSSRTGAATNIDNRILNTLPSLDRSLNDFTRFSPQANTSSSDPSILFQVSTVSFAGASYRYNNISIDGAVNNDVFGISGTGTPGGRVGTQPISLDAIEEIQIVVAPYDVRLGNFTGGGINAITKSGTNQIAGTVYGFYRNQYNSGVSPITNSTGERTLPNKFTDYQTGLSVGGPIIKNKLFFFLNTEITKRTEPTLFNKGESGSLVSVADIDAVQARAAALGITDLNSDGAFNNITESQKFFIRFDWNLNKNHKITLRHNYVRGYQENLSRSASTYNFTNAGIKFPITTNSTVLEWKASLGNKFANNLILNYTNINEDRDPLSPSTRVSIGTSTGSISFGGEPFSTWNQLTQRIISLTDNFNIFLGRHTLTIGTHNEFFGIKRDLIFNSSIYGVYNFTLAGFLNSANVAPFFQLSYNSSNPSTLPSIDFQAVQLGFYIQDEFEIGKNFKLTAGIRMDIPVFLNNPVENPVYNTSKEAVNSNTQTNSVPRNNPLWSPRIGFNWDVLGNQTLQIRGGAGIFTGRLPFVWIADMYANTGTDQGFISGSSPTFRLLLNPDNQSQLQNALSAGLPPISRTEVDVIDKDFKFPQVFRVDLAIDYKLPIWGLVATFEGLFTQNINNIDFKDLNLGASTRNLSLPNGAVAGDNRPIFPTISAINTTRLFNNANHTNIIYLTNTNEGYTYSATVQLTKPFSKGFSAMAAYTYGDAFSVNDGIQATTFPNWSSSPNVAGPNNAVLGRSINSIGSRIIASLSYRKEYLKNFATSIGLFYTGQSGTPLSYVSLGDINRSQGGANLVYIPRNQTEVTFATSNIGGVTYTAAQQWQILDQFISGNPYLNSRRGQYAEKNGDRTPFQQKIDVRLMQEFFIKTANGRRHTLQLTFDVFNVLNLLNKDWGFQYNPIGGSNNMFLTSFVGYQTGAGIVTGVNDRIPLYIVNGALINTGTGENWSRNTVTSRWQGQIGVRYIF